MTRYIDCTRPTLISRHYCPDCECMVEYGHDCPAKSESISPGPYLELFARRQRLGWDTWGNEALEHVKVQAG